MIANIPYKSHNNKIIFDFFTLVNKQLNNVNLAYDTDDYKFKLKNCIYIYVIENDIYFYLGLSQKLKNNKYFPSTTFSCKLQGIEFLDKDIDNNLYIFDIEKFNFTLSSSLNYKDRDKISLYFNDNKISYKVSNIISVELGSVITDQCLKTEVMLNLTSSHSDSSNKILTVENVDKNSPLLPFFNYKDCLDFTVSSDENFADISYDDENNCYINNYCVIDNKVKYFSSSLLRKDKFIFKEVENGTRISPSFWQILITIYGNRLWKFLHVYNSYAYIEYSDSLYIYVKFNFITQNMDYLSIRQDLIDNNGNFELVGKLSSDELFMINKFYTNVNRTCCYFDFSKQEFIGNGYIYSDNKEEYVNIKLENPNNLSPTLPLKLTFVEIKHYIGSDLSQKNFMLYIYTDGVNVKFMKYNINTDLLENITMFNCLMSKENLNI